MNDQGMKVLGTGKVFSGSWRKGKMEGFLRTVSQKDQVFEGFWLNGKKQGLCREYLESGEIFEGNYEGD